MAKHAIYCSTFCNFGHDVKTGRPIDHECRIIPPAALKAEMEGDFETAIELMQRGSRCTVHGRKRATNK